MQVKGHRRRLLSWLLVLLCILAIFLIVPLARTIQSFISARWGRSLFGYSVLAAVCVACVTLLYLLIFRLKIRSFSHYFWLLLVAALYIYFTLQLWEVPEEAIHFLEYGLLGYLLFRALKFNIRDKSIYVTAFLIGSLVGIFDEILQWIVPLRLWDIRDVGLNSLSSGLLQIGIWKGIGPRGISQKIKAKSWRTLSIIIGVSLILLGLCHSNTPQRVSRYTNISPALSFLGKEEPMNRFKHRYDRPSVGTFYSLLSPNDLLEEDRQRASQNGQLLKEWKTKDFREFRRSFHLIINPLLYELRSHVEIRDRNFFEAAQTDDIALKKRFLLTAYKENLILEKYYGHTLEKSSYRWDEDLRATVEASIDKRTRYRSPVQFGIVFPWSEETMWLLIFGSIIFLIPFNLLISRFQKFS